MKRQVSVKVYMDEDLYQYYSSIADGRKGRVIREALQLHKDLSSLTSARTLTEIMAEIKQGFDRIERLLTVNPGEAISPGNKRETTGNAAEKNDLADMFENIIQIPEG